MLMGKSCLLHGQMRQALTALMGTHNSRVRLYGTRQWRAVERAVGGRPGGGKADIDMRRPLVQAGGGVGWGGGTDMRRTWWK